MMMLERISRVRVAILPLLLISSLLSTFASSLRAQSQPVSHPEPSLALNSALVAACKENEADFAKYLAGDNPAAFQNLPGSERVSLMQRFVLLDSPGRPLLDTDPQGHPILRCESEDATQTFKFGAPRINGNLAYIPITIAAGRTVQFGLLREGDDWKLLSLGLLMIDIPQLEEQWAAQALQDRERGAIDTMKEIADAIHTYESSFGKLPDSLAQLGPAKNGVSPGAANLLDTGLAAGKEGGYAFRYVLVPAPGGAPSYELSATPVDYGKSGKRSFLMDREGKIHAADKRGATATSDDPVVLESDSSNPE
ncbi:MAG TPA: hypothetical protein VGS15_03005 [Candidatus Acidoferrales bacterium]|nr:hypothetical protein [Candidatus Acidoferrales bacterium]